MGRLILLFAALLAGAWGYHYQTRPQSPPSANSSHSGGSSAAVHMPGSWGDALGYANTAAALAKLREYQVAQDHYRIDELGGDFAFARQLPDLFHLKGRSAGETGLISRDLAHAWSGATQPVPYQGYLFADITHGENGLPLDPHMQYGLSAYPAQADARGSAVLLVLNDERTACPISETRPVSGGTYTLWAAPADRAKGPVTRWPSDVELRAHYVKLTRSVTDAQREIASLLERTPPMSAATSAVSRLDR